MDNSLGLYLDKKSSFDAEYNRTLGFGHLVLHEQE